RSWATASTRRTIPSAHRAICCTPRASRSPRSRGRARTRPTSPPRSSRRSWDPRLDATVARMRILIVVASATGRTARMAEAVAQGATDAGAEATLRRADEATDADLLAADGVIVGSGVHMGGIESSMRAFFERGAPLWIRGSLIGKVGAAFVSAGEGVGGGAELALLALLANLAEHGMLLATMPNRLEGFGDAGCHLGASART